jgi:hypothetical protein
LDQSDNDFNELDEAKRDLEKEKRALVASLNSYDASNDKLEEKNILLNAQAQFVDETRQLEMEIESAILELSAVVEQEKKNKQQQILQQQGRNSRSQFNPAFNPGGTVL